MQKFMDEGAKVKGRGDNGKPSDPVSNLILVWGCAPSKIVLLETNMILNFFETLRDRYCRKTLAVTFPKEFESMLFNAKDERWEIYKSNNIQPCKIFYEKNKATSKIGVILVHSKCKSSLDKSILSDENERTEKLREKFVPLKMKN